MRYLLMFLLPTALFLNTYGQTIDTSFWDTNRDVNCMVSKGDTLYIGGAFSFVGKVTGGLLPINIESGELVNNYTSLKANITCIIPDLAEGWFVAGLIIIDTGNIANKSYPFIKHILPDFSLDPNFNLSLGDFNDGGLAMQLWNDKLIVGGDFDNIQGISCYNLGIINTQTLEIEPFSVIPDGIVNDIEIINDTVYIAGSFSQLGSYNRKGLASYNLTTNALLDFDPKINADEYFYVEVKTIAVAGNKLFIGGSFDSIGGNYYKNFGIINRITGEDITTNIRTDKYANYVEALAIYGDTLIIGGSFDSVLNFSCISIAAINLSTETLLSSFPQFGDDYYNRVTSIYKNDSNLYVGGSFRNIDEVERSNIALVNFNTFSLLSWNPGTGGTVYSIAGDSNTVMVGGYFHTSYGEIRNCIAAFDLNTSQLLPLKVNPGPYYNDPMIKDMDIIDNTLYFGGRFHTVNGYDRLNAAAVDRINGSLIPWDPSVNSNVKTIEASQNLVYIGGYFNNVGGEPRSKLAAVDAITGQVTSWDPNPQSTPGSPLFIEDIKIFEDTVYVGGYFKQVNGADRNGFAAINANTGQVTDWYPGSNDQQFSVYSIEISDGWLMIGGYITSVYGTPVYGFAAFDIYSHELKTNNPFSPNVLGYLYAIAKYQNIIYCGGVILSNEYPAINNSNSLAFHSISGQIDDSWNADFGNRSVTIADIHIAGDKVFLGTFDSPYAFTEGKRKYFMAVPLSTLVGYNNLNKSINTLSVYPNPTSDYIIFDLENFEKKVQNISIYTVKGQKILTIETLSDEYFSSNVEDLPSGNYFFIVNGESTILSTGNFIKR